MGSRGRLASWNLRARQMFMALSGFVEMRCPLAVLLTRIAGRGVAQSILHADDGELSGDRSSPDCKKAEACVSNCFAIKHWTWGNSNKSFGYIGEEWLHKDDNVEIGLRAPSSRSSSFSGMTLPTSGILCAGTSAQ